MTTSRHAAARLHPALIAVLIAFGATALLAALVASLAQASAPVMAPAPAVALAAAPASSAAQPHQAAPAQPLPADATPVEYAPGVVLVKLKSDAAQALAGQGAMSAQGGAGAATQAAQNGVAVAGLFQSYGVTGAEPLLDTGLAALSALRAASGAGAAPSALANVYRLHLAPQFDAQQMALALAADPSVEYAEPDYIARAAVLPDDPEFAGQWALAKIGAPAAWDVQTGDPAIVIAVIDSGVDMAHPEFAGRLWENDDPVDGVDNDLNGFIDDTHGWNAAAGSNDLLDANGHGTQVAGVFGAAANNGQGVAGLCWGCKLMFANAMQASGVANYSDIARAVIYASSNGAQVINLSLGGYTDSAALREAIQEASTTAVIVAGAGNDDGSSPFYPAAYPQVLAVAATDPDDQKAIFSNSGAWLDLSAPGLDIRTTALGGGYATESGTSLASAHVAGLAGLVRSQHPQWTPEQVRWQLLNTAADIDAANPTKIGQLGAGRIDAAAALATDPQAQAAVQSATIDGAAGVRPAPGQSVQLVLSVQNQWLPAQNLQATLTSSDPNVSITDAAGSFGDLMPGQSGSNAADPFAVTISNAASYNAVLNFTLTLSGDGGYRLSLPVTIQVRSAIETLGNTQYTQDTTWTNDKTYVLAGSVIVGQGVTLTIQPGTLVKADPGKFLRIDGTLIASGTAEQPIVFTTNATDNATWSGIRFTASAVDATFDVDGVYTGGSIVRHAGIRRADTGLSLAGRTPYIADSTFTSNSLAIQTWTEDTPGGRVTIERNRFTGNAIDVGGGATVLQNEFTAGANGDCGIHLSGGSPLLMQNSFSGECGIGGSAGYPNIVSSTLAGGAIYLGLGDSTAGGSAPLPPFLQGPRKTQLAAGLGHTCALLESGGVQCWGWNESGQLGTGNNNDANTPQAVVGLAGAAKQLAVGGDNNMTGGHTCALLENGSVQCWGGNNDGQLGTGNNNGANTPQAVIGLASAARQLVAGEEHTCALLENGSVQCWGRNAYGQLGVGNNADVNTPQAVIGLASAAAQLAAGEGHTCALLESGSVQCWGSNARGQLGVGNNDSANTPQAVIGLAGAVRQLTAGYAHTCALLDSGSVQCWGSNAWGQLGVGNNNSANTPQVVIGLAGTARQLAAAYGHTCALLEGGYVQCWGYNEYGQLGLGNNTNVNTPQLVIGLGGVSRQLAPGRLHTCALLESGSVQCWGWNMGGQLGVGNNTDANLPQDTLYDSTYIAGITVQNGGGIRLGAGAGNWRVQQNSLIANSGNGIDFSCDNCIVDINNNILAANGGSGLKLTGSGMRAVGNTLVGNQSYGLVLGGSGMAAAHVQHNNLVGNGPYEIYLESGSPGSQNFTLDATNNFWNVAEASIPARVRDCTFDENGCNSPNATVGKVAYVPPLAAPEQAAPAFASTFALLPDTVGVERGTLAVEFSKPMDTSILPAARFQEAEQPVFAFENGQWVSATRFEATFDFTALVAPGYYTVTVAGAVGSDGIPAYAAKADAFRVDFGAGVLLDPPAVSIVRAQTDGSLSNLSAAWQNGSPNLDQYRYAIGTAPDRRDVVGWTHLAANSFTRNDLNLVKDQPYYVIVQAHNTVGLWGPEGVSNAVIGGHGPGVYLPFVTR